MAPLTGLHGTSRSVFGLVFVAALIAFAPDTATAHGAVHEQIAALTIKIGRDPHDADLYLRRGELYADDGDWKSALDDFQRADELDSDLVAIDLARGRTLFNAGRFEPAKIALDRFLTKDPFHAEGRILRARALAQLGQETASVTDYTQAINYLASLGVPNPDYYLERAQVSAARGLAYVPDALHGLDEGIATLGMLATFQLYAIELELSLGRTDAALARLESLAGQSDRRESLLARLGEILELAGKTQAARAAYEQAVAAIDKLSPRHRSTRSTIELETQVRNALARLQRSEV